MKIARILLAFFLLTVIISSLCTILYPDRMLSTFSLTGRHNLLFAQIGFGFSVIFSDRPPPLNQSTRTRINSFVDNNPGVQFRGICNELNLSIGVAQYNLGILVKAGLLSIFKDGRYKRFFKSHRFTKEEMATISLLRHSTVNRLVSLLLSGTPWWHQELASRLSISSQALTWEISNLEKRGLVRRREVEMKTYYYLEETDMPVLRKCMSLLDPVGKSTPV